MNVAASIAKNVKWSSEEAKLRVELAAAYRLTAKLGMDDLIYTHLSARVPGPELHFLLNPYGMLFSEVTASSLIKVDQNGEVVESNDDRWVHNPTGFVLHSAIHRSGDDRVCVFHGHPINAMAVSSLECGLLPLTVWAQQFYKRVSYHPYEGPPVRLDERDRVLANMGNTQAMLMQNHGVLTTGRTVAEAFILMYYLEKSCEVQLKAQSSGQQLIIPSEEISEYSARLRYSEEQLTANPGALEWQALVRKLDSEDPSYRN
jgi:ribulose-5-phosphate 4-epimerase/fuculose-1-phosphate aldolase